MDEKWFRALENPALKELTDQNGRPFFLIFLFLFYVLMRNVFAAKWSLSIFFNVKFLTSPCLWHKLRVELITASFQEFLRYGSPVHDGVTSRHCVSIRFNSCVWGMDSYWHLPCGTTEVTLCYNSRNALYGTDVMQGKILPLCSGTFKRMFSFDDSLQR